MNKLILQQPTSQKVLLSCILISLTVGAIMCARGEEL